ARLLDNYRSIEGTDILFNMYARNGRTNMFTRNQWVPTDSRFLDATFKFRNPSDVWMHGSYWDQLTATASNQPYWTLMQENATGAANRRPWTGTLHIDEPNWWGGAVITNPGNPAITACGGLVLRSPENNQNQDLMAQNTIVFADGQYRDVKIQQDVALLRLRQQALNTAEGLFEPIARLSQTVRDTANTVVKHMIDVARVMAIGAGQSTNGLARNDFGWLPEATVHFEKPSATLKAYPNPAQDFCTVELPTGQPYNVTVLDAVGRVIVTLNTVGNADLDTKDWKSGIYMVQAVHQTSKQQAFAKMVIQR
ncbi:MAG: Secretion system C-terminal sorting domain, partial [Bacteroidota bacterium]